MLPGNQDATLDEFLNPKSMITPGIAGGVVMLITNTLCLQFPEVTPRWIGILLSFIVGLLALVAGEIPKWQRSVYYVLNSLVIFAVAIGTTYAGNAVTRSAMLLPKNFIVENTNTTKTAMMDMFIDTAYAEGDRNDKNLGGVDDGKLDKINEKLDRQERELDSLKQENEELRKKVEDIKNTVKDAGGAGVDRESKTPEKSFFKRW